MRVSDLGFFVAVDPQISHPPTRSRPYAKTHYKSLTNAARQFNNLPNAECHLHAPDQGCAQRVNRQMEQGFGPVSVTRIPGAPNRTNGQFRQKNELWKI